MGDNGKIQGNGIPLSLGCLNIRAGWFIDSREQSKCRCETPSSEVALEYLTRFCSYHRLYGQCFAALAGELYIPLLSGSSVPLPMTRPFQRLPANIYMSSLEPFPAPQEEQGKILAQCMTLGSNVWGMRSLLCGTFFNIDIECNLVSAWLDPASAI